MIKIVIKIYNSEHFIIEFFEKIPGRQEVVVNLDLYARELLTIWEKFEKFNNFLQHLSLCFNGSQNT